MKQLVSSHVEMRAANGGKFSDVDYIHYVLHEISPAVDFLNALMRLMTPDFTKIDGRTLIPALGAVDRYPEYLKAGQKPQEAQYWANLVELSELAEGMTYSQAQSLGKLLSRTWQNALSSHQGTPAEEVILVERPDNSEVFVTIASKDVAR